MPSRSLPGRRARQPRHTGAVHTASGRARPARAVHQPGPRRRGLPLDGAAGCGSDARARARAPTALPVLRSGGQLSGATVTQVNPSAPAMTINQTAPRALIDWASFSIGAQASVTVNQPGSSAILLNRVAAGTGTATLGPSVIDGLLQANGRVFILDPSGVVFGGGARVHVGGLLAAAMNMTSSDAGFLAGGAPLTLARDALQAGDVTVQPGAQIDGGRTAAGVTTPAAEVALLAGGRLQLAGTIDATRVVLGAAGGAQVPVGDSGFVTLSLTPAVLASPGDIAPTVQGSSSGSVRAPAGSVQVVAASNGTGSESAGVDWATPVDATGGSISMSGTSEFGAGVNLHGASISAAALPVTLAAASVELDGTSQSGAGVALSGVDINAGKIVTLTGRSLSGDAVQLSTTFGPVSLNAPTQRIVGRSDLGTGVFMAGASLGGDLIEVRGMVTPADPALPTGTGEAAVGADIAATTFTLGPAGQLVLAGRAELPTSAAGGTALGLLLDQVAVVAPAGAGRSVTVVGEAVNGTGSVGIAGFDRVPPTPWLAVRDAGGTGAAVGADVIIGADAPASGTAFGQILDRAQPLLLGLLAPPSIATSAGLNLRPAGVDLNGNIVEHTGQAIQIETFQIETDAAPGAAAFPFLLPGAWLVDRNVNAAATLTASRLVIGSSLHQGPITVAGGMLRADTLPLTLQSQGDGAAGISLGGNGTAISDLALLSAGPVTQTGALLADHLLLQGKGSNAVALADPGNAIGSLSFAGLGSLDLSSTVAPAPPPAPPVSPPVTGPAAAPPRTVALATPVDPTVLSIGAATVQGYDATTATFGDVVVNSSGATGKVLIRANGRSITLDGSIALGATGASLDLVTDRFFASPGAATLSAGPGGTWRVWAPNWVGSQPGSVNGNQPALQMYGCVFGDVSLCSISQVALPGGRSGLFYAEQPTLTVNPVATSGVQGSPLPSLPYTLGGLIGADSAAGAVTGTLTTPATPTSPVGSYPVAL
ncbi:MAG: hypothetical protein RLZZ584_4523, partial [Pseudomonadota bacterium]